MGVCMVSAYAHTRSETVLNFFIRFECYALICCVRRQNMAAGYIHEFRKLTDIVARVLRDFIKI